ncbi:MAG: glycosyltransferase family 2 protein [bacterium]
MSSTAVVIIPTYNEKENIHPVVAELSKVFSSISTYKMLILFVDDNSPDGTAKAIASEIKSHSFVHLLNNKKKGGLGHAYKKGMQYALTKLSADIVFEFDADLSHDSTKIPAMLRNIDDGADLVLAARYLKGGGIPANWPPHRKFLSIVGNLFIRTVMLNFSVHDWTTGYRAITRQVIEKIVPTLQHNAFNGYTWQIGFLVKSIQAGFKIGEVPFHFKDREWGYSKIGPEYIFNTLRYIMKVRLEQIINHRIFKFAVTGGIGALIQLTFLQVYRAFLPFQLAFFLSIETAIVSNFIFSNLWTFADRKLKVKQIPGKFLAFNLASGGSILIQQAIAFFGERLIGLFILFTLPIINFKVDTGTMYAVTGILVGMFWNFFAYSRIIWRKK